MAAVNGANGDIRYEPCSFRLSYMYLVVTPLLCLNINLTLRITFSFQIEPEYNENALGVINCYCNCAIRTTVDPRKRQSLHFNCFIHYFRTNINCTAEVNYRLFESL